MPHIGVVTEFPTYLPQFRWGFYCKTCLWQSLQPSKAEAEQIMKAHLNQFAPPPIPTVLPPAPPMIGQAPAPKPTPVVQVATPPAAPVPVPPKTPPVPANAPPAAPPVVPPSPTVVKV